MTGGDRSHVIARDAPCRRRRGGYGVAKPDPTPLDDFSTEAIESALRTSLVDGAGLKPRVAFGPLRTALSGKRISPPLFESMQILDKETTLARLERFRLAL